MGKYFPRAGNETVYVNALSCKLGLSWGSEEVICYDTFFESLVGEHRHLLAHAVVYCPRTEPASVPRSALPYSRFSGPAAGRREAPEHPGSTTAPAAGLPRLPRPPAGADPGLSAAAALRGQHRHASAEGRTNSAGPASPPERGRRAPSCRGSCQGREGKEESCRGAATEAARSHRLQGRAAALPALVPRYEVAGLRRAAPPLRHLPGRALPGDGAAAKGREGRARASRERSLRRSVCGRRRLRLAAAPAR